MWGAEDNRHNAQASLKKGRRSVTLDGIGAAADGEKGLTPKSMGVIQRRGDQPQKHSSKT